MGQHVVWQCFQTVRTRSGALKGFACLQRFFMLIRQICPSCVAPRPSVSYACCLAVAMQRWQCKDKSWMRFDVTLGRNVRVQDPSIKDMAEQIAQDPAFAQMTAALQQSMGAGGELRV